MNGLVFWRGDKSIESSQVYLMNKGEFMKRYKAANETVANNIMEKITKEGIDEL